MTFPKHLLAIPTIMALLLTLLLPHLSAEDVECLACHGAKTVVCTRCTEGKAKCPSKCLKKDTPGWKKMKVDGHGPDELWMQFNHPKGGWYAWNQNHIGELIVVENGTYVNKGRCPQCAGSTQIACKICKGTSQAPCKSCSSTGRMTTEQKTAFEAAAAAEAKANTFTLKDGTVITGKKMGELADKILVKGADGTLIEIPKDQLAPPAPEP